MLVQDPLKQQIKSSLCWDPVRYRRRKTRVVMVGSVGVGGSNPIRIQSMTTTRTDDVAGTVSQIKRLAEAGCEIVRITAPTEVDAALLEKIKSELIKGGILIPLVADIHFRPEAALVAAEFVEKVRVNPGNYADSKAFKIREYTDLQYQAELEKMEEKFTPLVLKLKRLGKSLRIGTNHGSLSDRILNRFGDTPLGMVESALEFLRVCQKNDFHEVIFSMKSSNPKVMIAAYRLLAERLWMSGDDYPFHLGVTEAGGGEDGRIKSSLGIGSLLEDGIGDTIRVSLTEDPESEIPVARELARRADFPSNEPVPSASILISSSYDQDALFPSRRESMTVKSGVTEMGGGSPIRVLNQISLDKFRAEDVASIVECRINKETIPEIIEVLFQGDNFIDKFSHFRAHLTAETKNLSIWVGFQEGRIPDKLDIHTDGFSYHAREKLKESELAKLAGLCRQDDVPLTLWATSPELLIQLLGRLKGSTFPLMAGLEGSLATHSVHPVRLVTAWLKENNLALPILLSSEGSSGIVGGSAVVGSLLCDGIGDAIRLNGGDLTEANLDFSYNLLQATGHRITKTEFVSCPSCGRTLFDLQSTTERIKSKTGHLKGVKIAIMGCIVNGPGEMADADFGYVGGGPGKINLYVGKQCVEKSIPADLADEKLISLIQAHGKWVDPN